MFWHFNLPRFLDVVRPLVTSLSTSAAEGRVARALSREVTRVVAIDAVERLAGAASTHPDRVVAGVGDAAALVPFPRVQSSERYERECRQLALLVWSLERPQVNHRGHRLALTEAGQAIAQVIVRIRLSERLDEEPARRHRRHVRTARSVGKAHTLLESLSKSA